MYTCRKCGDTHSPPTGEKCRRLELEENESHSDEENPLETEVASEHSDKLLQIMLQMKEKMENMDISIKQRIDGIEERIKRVETGGDNESVVITPNGNNIDGALASVAQMGPQEIITPASLRSDVRAMQRAAQRIAQFELEDFEEDGDLYPKRRSAGKKSGSVMTVADNVKTRIDWPHMHIKRAGSRVAIEYKELKVAKFLNMLDARKGQ